MMFDRIIAALHQYQEKYHLVEGYNLDLCTEVQERLKQLKYIIARVQELELRQELCGRQFVIDSQKHFGPMPPPGQVSAPRELPAAFGDLQRDFWEDTAKAEMEIRILTEAFYYFAFRVISIADGDKKIGKPLPGVSFGSDGVRDVRNHLIEHPEKKHQIFRQSFSFGHEDGHGPRLKTGGPPTESAHFQDKGLYRNAAQFTKNLLAAFERAMKESSP